MVQVWMNRNRKWWNEIRVTSGAVAALCLFSSASIPSISEIKLNYLT